MDDQPAEPAASNGTPTPAADDQPKFFKSANGMIAGATGLVIALGGLATAWTSIFPGKKAEEPAALAAPAEAVEPAAATQTEGDLPTYYEGDDAALEFADNQWTLTTSEGTFQYKEMLSPDEDRVLAYDKAHDEYLRWPVKGGMSEISNDEVSWTNWITLDPTTPPEEDAAGADQ